MERLEGKVAIVTGAGQGIGMAVAQSFAEEGARVITAHRNPGKGEGLVQELAQAGHEVVYVCTDVTRADDVARMVGAAKQRFGRVDILCNCAGIGLTRSLADSTQADYESIMNVNVRGVFNCCQQVMPLMQEQLGGSIVNLASVAAVTGFPREALYSASKGAVLSLTRQLALDAAAFGVRVNAICPGFIDTPAFRRYLSEQQDAEAAMNQAASLHPLGRVGQPKEVAAAAVFLASDESSFITGACLSVDGGLLVRT